MNLSEMTLKNFIFRIFRKILQKWSGKAFIYVGLRR